MTSEEEQEFHTYLDKNNNISWYAKCDGDYDIAIIVWAKTIQEYEHNYNDIRKHYGKHFNEIQFSIATEINYYKHNFLTSTKESKTVRFGTVEEIPTIDQLDNTILVALNKDARTNLVTIAMQTNTSAKLVHDRIKKLQEKGIILGFNTKIDHKKIGYTHRKVQFWLNDTTDETIKKITGYLKEQSQTIFTVTPIGGCDYECELMTKTNEEYYEFIKAFRTTHPTTIARYRSFIIREEPKVGLF